MILYRFFTFLIFFSLINSRTKTKKNFKRIPEDRIDENQAKSREEPDDDDFVKTTTNTPKNIHTEPKKVNNVTKQIFALKSILQKIRSWETTTYEEMSWLLNFLNKSCEPYAYLYSIGSSVQNREIWVIALSDDPHKHEIGEPEVKIVGNIHGNENVGREVILHMVDHICSNIDNDISLKNIILNTRLHFLPSLNPDGYEMARVHSQDGKNIGRLNANGIDLNRNFPDQFFPSFHDPEPETVAMIKWMNDIPFMLSASLHDGAFVVTYPFDDSPSGQTKYSATPDDDIFRYLSRLYAETHPEMHLSNMGNCTRYSQHKKFIGGITNGAEWSSLSNTMQDYNYVQTNCFEITVEMSCINHLNSTIISNTFKQNYNSLIAFIRQALRGIKGIVVDNLNNPLKEVHISISDRKHDVKTAENGDFWRLVLPGTYEVTARLRGYESSTRIVTVENSLAQWVNFTLVKSNPDPSITALGHVGAFQKSLNLMTFESDGRDFSDSENKDDEMEQKREVDENSEDIEERDFSKRKSINPSQSSLLNNFKSKNILPLNQLKKPENTKSIQTDSQKKEFKVNDIVSCQIPGRNENLIGKIRWNGSIPELASHTNDQNNQSILGIDLFKPDDLATDGTFLGKRYFTTKQNYAYFIPNNLCTIKKN